MHFAELLPKALIAQCDGLAAQLILPAAGSADGSNSHIILATAQVIAGCGGSTSSALLVLDIAGMAMAMAVALVVVDLVRGGLARAVGEIQTWAREQRQRARLVRVAEQAASARLVQQVAAVCVAVEARRLQTARDLAHRGSTRWLATRCIAVPI